MKKIILVLVSIQFCIIIVLVFIIYKKNISEIKRVNVNPIKKESLVFAPTENLKYFYEPHPEEEVNTNSPYSQGVLYTINSDFLNERFEYTVEKPKNTYRIITLGDSFTFGLFVNTPDNWTERLEDLLNQKLKCNNIKKFEVINLSVHGYDFAYSLERFKKRGLKYNPDLVLWMLVDFHRINEKLRPLIDYYLTKFKENGQLDKANANKDYYLVWRTAVQQLSNEMSEEQIYGYQTEVFKQFFNIWRRKSLLIPVWGNNKKSIDLIKEVVKNQKQKNLINIFENLTNLRENNKVFPNDSHPTKKGHQIIANEIFKYLLDNKLIPCKQ